jgi:hypothetical protein
MNLFKKSTEIILSLIIALSAAVIPTTVFAAEEKEITLTRFGGYTYNINNEAGYSYNVKIENNTVKAISAKLINGVKNDFVEIAALKPTGNKNPLVKIVKKNKITREETTVANLKVTVKRFLKKINFGTVRISKGKNKQVLVKKRNVSLEYEESKRLFHKYYTVKVKNKRIATFGGISSDIESKYTYFCFNGKRKGTTTGGVYVKGSKVKVGTIKIKVGNYKAKIDPLYKNLETQYSPHGVSDDTFINIFTKTKDGILNAKSGAKYSYKVADKTIVDIQKSNYCITLKAKKVGNTKINVYEKVKNKKKTKLGSFNLKVTEAKMADVFYYNAYYNDCYDDGTSDIFGSEILNLSKGNTSFDLMNNIDKLVLNHKVKGTYFSKDEYSVTFHSADSEFLAVNENGIINALMSYEQFKASKRYDQKSLYEADIVFSIKFSDGSTINGIFKLGIK